MHAVGYLARRGPPLAALFALTVAACGTETSTTSEWSAQVPVGGPLRSIVVFGVGAGVDAGNRRILEDELSARLIQDGVRAKPSYELFPDTTPTRDEAKAAVQGAGYDGVLVSRMRGVTETQHFVPDSYNGDFWNGYYGASGWYGGSVITDKNVHFENTLWDVRGNGKLLWYATTSTLNPTSGKDFAAALSRTVVPELGKAGFIPPAEK